LYVCNVDEASAVNGNKHVDAVRNIVKDEDAEILVVAAKIESEIAEFETYDEKKDLKNQASDVLSRLHINY